MATVKKNFNTFQEDTNINLTDKFVGFSNTSFGGERKWSLQTLITNIFQKGNTYQMAKAWVNFSGTTSPGTIRSSFNVSSVIRNAIGNYTVIFTTAMNNDNYVVAALCSDYSTRSVVGGVNIKQLFNASAQITCGQGTTNVLFDPSTVTVVVFAN